MKKCSEENCENGVWGKGKCLKHYPRTPLQKSAIKKKEKNKDDVINYLVKRNEFFESIWKKRKHYCEECGKFLGHTAFSYHFDHILEKSKYPDLEFEERNIQLLCLDHHSSKTNGFISEKVKQRIEEVKEMFDK